MTKRFREVIESRVHGVFRCHAVIPDTALEFAVQHDLTAIPIRLAATRDKKGFLNAVAQALQFPDYFGHNWDAFYDCLVELKLGREGTLLLLHDASNFARAEPEEFAAAAAALQDATDYWKEKGQLLTVIVELKTPALAPELQEIIPPGA
ncbi:MAG TPA: barstar family protein [Burkholderiales bacterium]|nr:barstar family protein [Burkholderiales bacterium]